MASQVCPHCGEKIDLKSFRAPPNQCPHCGKLRNPDAVIYNLGCAGFAFIGLTSALAFGYLAFQFIHALGIGREIAGRIGFLAGADCLAISTLAYLNSTPSGKKNLTVTNSLLMFSLLGLKCGSGLGGAVVVWALVNGAIGIGSYHVISMLPVITDSDDTQHRSEETRSP